MELSILADFVSYYLNSLNRKLNHKKNNMHGSIWTKNDQSGRQHENCFFLRFTDVLYAELVNSTILCGKWTISNNLVTSINQ